MDGGWTGGGGGPQGGGWVVGRGDEMRRCVGIGSDWVGLDRIGSARRIGPDRVGSNQSGDFLRIGHVVFLCSSVFPRKAPEVKYKGIT